MASVFKFLLALQLLLTRPASIKWILLATRNFHSPLVSWRAVVSHTNKWLVNCIVWCHPGIKNNLNQRRHIFGTLIPLIALTKLQVIGNIISWKSYQKMWNASIYWSSKISMLVLYLKVFILASSRFPHCNGGNFIIDHSFIAND